MPIQVSLSPEQLVLAEQEATRRQTVNEQRGLRGRNRGPATGSRSLAIHKIGAVGEVAVASYLGLEAGLFREQFASRGSYDLPYGIDVKTRSNHNYDLIIMPREKPDKRLVLVTSQFDKILIHGWCVAGECMRPEFWSDPAGGRPAYFVPKSKLRDIADLQEIIKKGEGHLTPVE